MAPEDARDELLRALLIERHTSPWWTAKTAAVQADDEMAQARRLRDLNAAMRETKRGAA